MQVWATHHRQDIQTVTMVHMIMSVALVFLFGGRASRLRIASWAAGGVAAPPRPSDAAERYGRRSTASMAHVSCDRR